MNCIWFKEGVVVIMMVVIVAEMVNFSPKLRALIYQVLS